MNQPAVPPSLNPGGMSFRQLNVFLTVAECHSFTEAAAALHMTQSGLSRVIRNLEQQTGETLFERTPHGLRLTPAGEVLLPFARKFAAIYSHALGGAQPASAPVLRLAASSEVLAVVLPHLLPALIHKRHEQSIEVHEMASHRVIEEVRAGHVDLGLAMATEKPTELESIPLLTSAVGLLAGKEQGVPESIHSFTQLDAMRYARLQENMVLPRALQPHRSALRRYFESPIVFNSMNCLLGALAEGAFVTLTSAAAASSPLAVRLRFVSLAHLLPPLGLYLVHRRQTSSAHWIATLQASVRAAPWHAGNQVL
ncbi:LysR family transcriptional regulator [Acidovorax sp. RAC01]|uniref:LysR family transcriptional regulator n=1 Tax=Acidovorax sp. RAC01 TaxID=1842533 RepID=UPI00085893C2|nr:LysR family transcriptional regulator [Acidovorax sp. RAC01]AOG21691.1 bacterial regulatory helix-turn-helix, lysR family protein [Acidovorax sp. RAC01]